MAVVRILIVVESGYSFQLSLVALMRVRVMT